jgi:CheY-like chemotaxis protein
VDPSLGVPARAPTTCDGHPPKRALVVEDNSVNQLVATRLLEKLGWRSDVAGNGLEAVQAAAAIRYDLILMDCQMPEMNGFDATRRIRECESGSETRVPIIALTAGAMKGDMEACLAAGMDEYLAKPLSSEALRDVLSRVLEPSLADA